MKHFEKINPAVKASPLLIAILMVLPQLLLALLRSRTLMLIHGEMHDNFALIYANYLGVPLALAAAATALVVWSLRRGGDLPRWSLLVAFLLQMAALVFFLLNLDHMRPSAVDEWIVPEGPFLLLQLSCATPGLFLSLICAANLRYFNTIFLNIATSFGVLVVVPGSLYFGIIAMSALTSPPEALIIAIFVAASLVAAFAFLQLLLWLSGQLRHRWISTILFALVFPVCGLILNRLIPFPADLQHWGFYVLAIANGLILLCGCHPVAAKHPVCALATAFSYPFTCYFFILFLPFLPFSLPAMIAVGSGFLILTPAVLFILHTSQLAAMFTLHAARYGSIRVAAVLAAAFLIVPAAYLLRADFHRRVFQQTLDRVYASPLDNNAPMPSSNVAGYVLERLQDAKDGVYVPILSEVYNRIVFNGMVLPDKKLEQLDMLFLGKKYTREGKREPISFYSLFTDEFRRSSGRAVRAPLRDVSLTGVECSSQSSGGVTEASVLMTMHNNEKFQAEYVAEIKIPDGAFVSGFELEMGGKMVSARLSDRRAALWVYHMIRDNANRDPGLLVYTGPGTLRLSVFPISGGAECRCAIRLLYPENTSTEIQIGERTVALPKGTPVSVSLVTPGGHTALYLPSTESQGMHGLVRTQEQIPLSGTSETAGYCPEWQVKDSLLQYWNSGQRQFRSVPLFVTESTQTIVEIDQAAYWLPLIPDSGWLKTKNDTPPTVPVIPFMCGNEVRVILEETGGLVVFASTGNIDRFDPDMNELRQFNAAVHLDGDSRYARAIDLMQAWWQTQLHPETESAARKDLLQVARNINVLIPSAAFIVVETNAQNKAFEVAENKSLENHSALAFDEYDETKMNSPEPDLLLLFLLAIPLISWMHRRRPRRSSV